MSHKMITVTLNVIGGKTYVSKHRAGGDFLRSPEEKAVLKAFGSNHGWYPEHAACESDRGYGVIVQPCRGGGVSPIAKARMSLS